MGDDKTYYETAKLHDTQQAKSRISESAYFFHYGSRVKSMWSGIDFLFWTSELFFLNFVGLINDWGARLLRPLLILLILFAAFGAIYGHLSNPSILHPWQKSFDIATLAGYTNESESSQPVFLRTLEGGQLLISILLYTIFFSTAIARFSRTR